MEDLIKEKLEKGVEACNSILDKIEEAQLIIPAEIFLEQFGGSFGYLQDYLKELISKYKLEVCAFNRAEFKSYRTINNREQIIPEGTVIINFRKDQQKYNDGIVCIEQG